MAVLKSSVTDGDHMQGSERSEVTLVEYGDYQCRYCGEAYPTVKEIKRYFGDRRNCRGIRRDARTILAGA